MEACIKWAVDTNIDAKFEEFARENSRALRRCGRIQGGGAEHKLGLPQCHERFLEMFEEQLEAFFSSRARPRRHFSECQDVMNDQFCALFEDHEHKWFVDMLLGMMEYKHFYGLMINGAAAQRQVRAERAHGTHGPQLNDKLEIARSPQPHGLTLHSGQYTYE